MSRKTKLLLTQSFGVDVVYRMSFVWISNYSNTRTVIMTYNANDLFINNKFLPSVPKEIYTLEAGERKVAVDAEGPDGFYLSVDQSMKKKYYKRGTQINIGTV